MPDLSRQIIIDTSPLLALCAACGDFAVLRLADKVVREAMHLAGEEPS